MKNNPTIKVVRQAMKEASKDVLLPKCVREGRITNATAARFSQDYNPSVANIQYRASRISISYDGGTTEDFVKLKPKHLVSVSNFGSEYKYAAPYPHNQKVLEQIICQEVIITCKIKQKKLNKLMLLLNQQEKIRLNVLFESGALIMSTGRVIEINMNPDENFNIIYHPDEFSIV